MADGQCRGVIWTCNPRNGPTATESIWGPTAGDPTLNALLSLLRLAASLKGSKIDEDGYIALLNFWLVFNESGLYSSVRL